jgi:hypothetical protein
MPRVTIDTTEARAFEAVQPGPYPMKISSAEVKNSKNGEPMLLVTFTFEDPTVDKRAGSVLRNYMLAGKGAGFTREFWKAVTGEDIPIGGSFDIDTDDIVGHPVIVQIGNREYEGKMQNEAERVTSAA